MSAREDRPRRRVGRALNAEISQLVVQALHQFSGRGPTKASTTIGRNSVHCVIGDSLTTAERTLADAGHADEVILARKRMQDVMRPHLVAEVEELMQRKVIAFMSDNHIDPDYGIESFILEPEPDDSGGGSASAAGQGPAQPDESRQRISPRNLPPDEG